MPVLFTKKPDCNTIMGVWQITEAVDELEQKLVLTDAEKLVLDSYRHENRKKQWLSYRVLINELQDELLQVHYTDFGKPYLKNEMKRKHISITHSGEYSAVLINPVASVGIDIEKISKRIDRVSSKFLSEPEIEFLDKDNFLEHLTICWTAKEAMFKICGNDFYDFKKQMRLFPFRFSQEGLIRSELIGEQKSISLTVHFERISDYYLAYAFLMPDSK